MPARRDGLMTRFGIAVFALAVVSGPYYTVEGYSILGNLISELAAQNTPNNFLMSLAFIVLGAGIAADGLRAFHRALAPFLLFGLFTMLVGLFGHRPINPDIPYLAWAHAAHGALAMAAGISITAAFTWQGFRQPGTGRRALAFALALACLALPLAMLAIPAAQGLIQRTMYLLVFSWLWVYYPRGVYS